MNDSLRVAAPATLCLFAATLSAQQQDRDREIRELRARLERLENRIDYGEDAPQFGTTYDVSVTGAPIEHESSASRVTFGSLRGEQPLLGEFNFDEALPEVTSGVDLRFWGRHKSDFRVSNFEGAFGLGFQTFIPNQASTGRDRVSFDPRDTRFGFAATHMVGDWRTRAVMELDFVAGFAGPSGSNLEPRLRLGYAELNHADKGLTVRIGQDWNPVAKQNPKTLDFGILSFSGNIWWRPPQITVTKRSGNVEISGSAFMLLNQDAQTRDETIPWLSSRIALHNAVGDGSLLALSGAWRTNDLAGNWLTAWMTAIEWKIPFSKSVILNGEVWGGQGLGNDFLRVGLDYNGTTGEEIGSWGGFANLEIKATDKFSINMGYGVDDPDDDDITGGVTPYLAGAALRPISFRLNQTAYINGRYAFSKHFGFGAEFLHQNTRTTLTSDPLEGERVTFSAWFIF